VQFGLRIARFGASYKVDWFRPETTMHHVPFHRSLVFKLLFAVTAVVVLCTIGSVALSLHAMRGLKKEILSRDLEQNRAFLMWHAQSWVYNTKLHIERNLHLPGLGVVPERMASLIENTPEMMIIQITDANGALVVDVHKPGWTGTTGPATDAVEEVVLIEEPLLLNGQPWGQFRIGYSMAYLRDWNQSASMNLDHLFPQIIRHTLLLMVVPWTLGLLLMCYLAFRLIQPIRRLTDATALIKQGAYEQAAVMDVTTDDEVGVLGAAFTEMARQLGRHVDAQHQLVIKAQQSETFLNSMLDQIPEMIFLKDAETLRFVYINASGEKLLGRKAKDLIGKSDYDFFPGDQADAFIRHDRACLQGKKRVEIHNEAIRAGDGTIHFLDTIKTPLWFEPEQKEYLLGLSRDVTEIKTVRDDQRHFFTNAPELLCITGFDGRVKLANPALQGFIGFSGDELVGRPIRDFVHRDDRAEFDRLISQMRSASISSSIIMRVQRRDGTLRHLFCTATSDAASEKIYSIARDISEQLALERQLVESSTREQERLAHDLHDGLGQTLTGLALRTKLLEKIIGKGILPSIEHTQQIINLANLATTQARAVARGMDPVILQEGLVYALRDLSAATSETTTIKCVFFHQPSVAIADKHVCAQLYRIAQEAVNNAIRHARPANILIRLFEQDQAVLLEVSDDGCGLVNPSPNGSGMRNMQYRCRMIGARLDVTSNPSGGTSVVVTLRSGVEAELEPAMT
jgi:PAS domain S-box-containing protein